MYLSKTARVRCVEISIAMRSVGFEKTNGFASPGGTVRDARNAYAIPGWLRLNQWALAGEWTAGKESVVLQKAKGRIAYRFQTRDVLVMGPVDGGLPVHFRVLIDGHPAGPAHGYDVDDQGDGTAKEPRLYQLIRQPKPIVDRDLELPEPGAEAFVFTFG